MPDGVNDAVLLDDSEGVPDAEAVEVTDGLRDCVELGVGACERVMEAVGAWLAV